MSYLRVICWILLKHTGGPHDAFTTFWIYPHDADMLQQIKQAKKENSQSAKCEMLASFLNKYYDANNKAGPTLQQKG